MKKIIVTGIMLTLLLISMLTLAFNFKSVKANPQLLATTKLSIVPSTIIGPPPNVGETFNINITITDVINFTGWCVGLDWNASILNCTSWTTLFDTAVMGPSGHWLEVEGTINNTNGQVYPPYACALKAGYPMKSGSGTLAQVNFTVLDYGFTWINLTEVIIESDREVIPVDVTNGTFTLLPVHDVAVTNVTTAPTEVTPGETVYINVTVKNNGTTAENFNVTAYYDNTEIDTQTVTNLAALAEENLTFTWDTIDIGTGEYTIKAVASQVPGETHTADNTYIDGTVTVTAPKLSIIPASIIGPPPDIGESFTLSIKIENAINFSAVSIGLAWNASVLQCNSFTLLPPGPVEGPIIIDGTINNTAGEIFPPYAFMLMGPPYMCFWGTIAEVEFQVSDYGFTWINLTYIYVELFIEGSKVLVPVDLINGTVALFPPAAPVANFTYSPSAPQVNQIVTFNASASEPGFNGTAVIPIANYTWDFGDGNVTTTTNPIIYHAYTTNDTYTFNLTVTCEDDSVLISLGLASNSTWQTVTITAVPVVFVHDVVVTSVTPSTTEAYPIWINPPYINVTVKNNGTAYETFTVTAYYNNTAFPTKVVISLAPSAEITITFQWQPYLPGYPDNPSAAWPYPIYIISANVSVVPGETNIDNNHLSDGAVTVKWPGDANGDGHVNLRDLSLLADHWFNIPTYDPQADINGDGEINLSDVSLLADHWYKGPLD